MTNMVMLSYNNGMKRVTISELKAKLSLHIRFVARGEEVLVCDRNKPVARLLPVETEHQNAHEQRLIERGLLALPRKKRPTSWPEPPGNVSDEVMRQLWRHEREGR